MKSWIKKILFLMFGKRLVLSVVNWIVNLWQRLKGRPYSFSEGIIIYKYFNSLAQTNKSILIDVGAHHGESLEPYISLKWKVIAFEPDTSNREFIQNKINLDKEKYEELSLFPYAISDKSKKSVSFYSSSEASTISSLSPFHETHESGEAVDVKTLREVLRDEGINNVTYLKIDAEGHDLFVLKGVDWEKFKPDLVMCEFEDNKTKLLGYDYVELGMYLVDKGYQVYLSEWEPIVKYGTRHKWVSLNKFPCNISNKHGWGNFIAVSIDSAKKYFDNECAK
jgi:FkbM family methyltransferase